MQTFVFVRADDQRLDADIMLAKHKGLVEMDEAQLVDDLASHLLIAMGASKMNRSKRKADDAVDGRKRKHFS